MAPKPLTKRRLRNLRKAIAQEMGLEVDQVRAEDNGEGFTVSWGAAAAMARSLQASNAALGRSRRARRRAARVELTRELLLQLSIRAHVLTNKVRPRDASPRLLGDASPRVRRRVAAPTN